MSSVAGEGERMRLRYFPYLFWETVEPLAHDASAIMLLDKGNSTVKPKAAMNVDYSGGKTDGPISDDSLLLSPPIAGRL